jgi:hypothetical protein
MDKPATERMYIYQNTAISSFTNKTIYNTRSRAPLAIKYSKLIGSHLTAAHIAFNLAMVRLQVLSIYCCTLYPS